MNHSVRTSLIARSVSLVTLASAFCLGNLGARADETSSVVKPNIVLYIADDHGRNDTSVYDAGSQAITPNMAKLASEGLTFNNAFVASPACGPSRSALLSGLMPARNGGEHNHERPRLETQIMITRMQAAGYEVACFGKVHHAKWIENLGTDFVSRNPKHFERDVKKFLKNRTSQKPLLLIVGDTRTHAPWVPHDTYQDVDIKIPDRWIDTPDTRRLWENYLGEVTEMDAAMGNIDQIAKEHFKSNDFLFIYTSDHGHAWPFGKWNLYDWGTRVGFQARWPGEIAANTRTDAMISWIDLFPTFLDLAGEEALIDIDGKSFAKVLTGESAKHRDLIFTTHSGDGIQNIYPIRAVRDTRFKFIRNIHPEAFHTTHTDMQRRPDHGSFFTQWEVAAQSRQHAKAVIDRYHYRPAVEFYDLRNDPEETTNVADDPAYAEEVAGMASLLKKWMTNNNDTVRMQHEPYLLSNPYSRDQIRKSDR